MSRRALRRHSEGFLDIVSLGPCKQSGKQRWPSRGAARQHLRNLKASDKRGRLLQTYRCKSGCGDWHVGHKAEPAA